MKQPLLIVALLVLPLAAWSQSDSTRVDSTYVVDTVSFDGRDLLAHSSPVTADIDFEKRLSQNPTVALFKSMVIPGWGQLGNRRYFKAVLFAGLDAWFIASAVHYGRQASDYRDLFEASLDTETRVEYYDLYLDRKDERNKFRWFAVIVTFVSMFDAFVDAHLSGYPVAGDNTDLSFDIQPTAHGGFVAAVSLDF